MKQPTIFALSTAPVRAALAVIRLSGADCFAALKKLGIGDLPPPRYMGLRRLHDPKDKSMLDEALVVCFPAPASFTGEDMAELHVHGGMAVLHSILQALGDIDNLRLAEAGEFTRRAVGNGRLDLTAAEAIADLIDAEGGAQQAQALRQLQGGLHAQMTAWRDALAQLLAHLEADLEFADEDLREHNATSSIGQQAVEKLRVLREAMQASLKDKRGLRLRDGLRIALLGAPNVGKSSILNYLAGKEAAIVSARAGTTRDIIEVAMVMRGLAVSLVDTAGLRAAGDDIEREGVRRALDAGENAAICLWIRAGDAPEEKSALAEFSPESSLRADFIVVNKIDQSLLPPKAHPKGDFAVSAQSGAGMEALLAALGEKLLALVAGQSAPILTRERHRQALAEAVACLIRAEQMANDGGDGGLELAAEDVRLAARALGRVIGVVDVESLLDIVFADFCIGK